jgi:hypothetical protein
MRGKAVAKAKGVLVELHIIALYDSSWRLQRRIEYMTGLGFVPVQIDLVDYPPLDCQPLVEIDCLFLPRAITDWTGPSQFIPANSVPHASRRRPSRPMLKAV